MLTARYLALLVLALGTAHASRRIKRQHNLYSVNDFLGQLGQLALQSQAQGGGGGPSNYLAGLLQGYQQQQPSGSPQYQQHYPQRPVPPEYLQDLQYQQQPGQASLGYDPVNGGFGLQPGGPGGAGALGVLGGPGAGGLGSGALGGLGGLAGLAGLAGLGGGLGGLGGGLVGLGGGLGGLGGGGLRPQGNYPFPRPPGGAAGTVSLNNALQSVARYDDLQCVPRLLCELTAGGRPGSAKQNQALPFVNRDTLVSLLTVLNFGTNSPLIVFGRAALLGYMAQGDPSSCFNAYPTCPRDPDRLVDYLNNHNGGFFRFFTGVASPHYQQEQQYLQHQQYQQYQQQLQYQGYRPGRAPYAPQYRDYEATTGASRSPSKVVFPEAKSLPPQAAESRILTKVHPNEASSAYSPYSESSHFLPTPRPTEVPGVRGGRKEKFPFSGDYAGPTAVSGTTVFLNGQHVPLHDLGDGTFTVAGGQFTFTNPYAVKTPSSGHRVHHVDFSSEVNRDNREYSQAPYIPNIRLEKPNAPVEIFPTRTGTGDLRLDPVEHLNLASSAGGRPQGKPFRFAGDGEGEGTRGTQQEAYRDYAYGGANRVGHAFRFPNQQQEAFAR